MGALMFDMVNLTCWCFWGKITLNCEEADGQFRTRRSPSLCGMCWTDNKLFIETFVATILGIVAFKLFYFSNHRITVADASLF